jgi:hypothetical protein
MILLEEKAIRDYSKEKIQRQGVGIIPMRDLIFTMNVVERMGHMKKIYAKSHGTSSNTNRRKKKKNLKHQI